MHEVEEREGQGAQAMADGGQGQVVDGKDSGGEEPHLDRQQGLGAVPQPVQGGHEVEDGVEMVRLDLHPPGRGEGVETSADEPGGLVVDAQVEATGGEVGVAVEDHPAHSEEVGQGQGGQGPGSARLGDVPRGCRRERRGSSGRGVLPHGLC